MNTTLKGNIFENYIFNIIRGLLNTNDLFINGKLSQIFQKKSYYSRDREKPIITDISIETKLSNTEEYSILTVFECKNYTSTVPIDDIEEFASKLSQIAGHNVKGVMVVNSNYATSCLTFARNKGIGLVRVVDEQLKWEVYRRLGENYISDNTIPVLTGQISPLRSVYIYDEQPFSSIPEYLLKLHIIDKLSDNNLKVPFLTEEKIELMCNELIPNIEPFETNIISLLEKNQVKLITNSFEEKILGKFSFADMSIHLSNRLDINGHRGRFTLAHELGHYFLHRNLSDTYMEIIDTEESIGNSLNYSNSAMKRIEYQANLFASSLLMPKHKFTQIADIVYRKYRVNRGRLYLDNQPCNKDMFYKVGSDISDIFNVSIEAIKYRLIGLNLLENQIDYLTRNILD